MAKYRSLSHNSDKSPLLFRKEKGAGLPFHLLCDIMLIIYVPVEMQSVHFPGLTAVF